MEISPEVSSNDGEKPAKDVEDADKDGFKSESETKANFGHYLRVFQYSTPFERAILSFASITSIGSGIVSRNLEFGSRNLDTNAEDRHCH